MVKYIKRIIVMVLCLSTCVCGVSASKKFKWRSASNSVVYPGEKITFKVSWEFVAVGTAVMEVMPIVEINGRKCLHIKTTAVSAPFFDSVFQVRDTNESWVDAQSFCSVKYVSKISEGNFKKTETISFDQPKNEFLVSENGKKGKIPLYVQDVLSSLYYLRTKKIAVGKTYQIDVHSGDLSWPLIVKIVAKENISIGANQYECYAVEPELREGAGIFRATGKIRIWLTADDKKIPIKMQSKIAIGSITAEAELINAGN